MTDGHKAVGKEYMSSLLNHVPNFAQRVATSGNLRDDAISGIYAACMVQKDGHGGISMEDAQIILDEWLAEMTSPPKPSWEK